MKSDLFQASIVLETLQPMQDKWKSAFTQIMKQYAALNKSEKVDFQETVIRPFVLLTINEIVSFQNQIGKNDRSASARYYFEYYLAMLESLYKVAPQFDEEMTWGNQLKSLKNEYKKRFIDNKSTHDALLNDIHEFGKGKRLMVIGKKVYLEETEKSFGREVMFDFSKYESYDYLQSTPDGKHWSMTIHQNGKVQVVKNGKLEPMVYENDNFGGIDMTSNGDVYVQIFQSPLPKKSDSSISGSKWLQIKWERLRNPRTIYINGKLMSKKAKDIFSRRGNIIWQEENTSCLPNTKKNSGCRHLLINGRILKDNNGKIVELSDANSIRFIGKKLLIVEKTKGVFFNGRWVLKIIGNNTEKVRFERTVNNKPYISKTRDNKTNLYLPKEDGRFIQIASGLEINFDNRANVWISPDGNNFVYHNVDSGWRCDFNRPKPHPKDEQICIEKDNFPHKLIRNGKIIAKGKKINILHISDNLQSIKLIVRQSDTVKKLHVKNGQIVRKEILAKTDKVKNKFFLGNSVYSEYARLDALHVLGNGDRLIVDRIEDNQNRLTKVSHNNITLDSHALFLKNKGFNRHISVNGETLSSNRFASKVGKNYGIVAVNKDMTPKGVVINGKLHNLPIAFASISNISVSTDGKHFGYLGNDGKSGRAYVVRDNQIIYSADIFDGTENRKYLYFTPDYNHFHIDFEKESEATFTLFDGIQYTMNWKETLDKPNPITSVKKLAHLELHRVLPKKEYAQKIAAIYTRIKQGKKITDNEALIVLQNANYPKYGEEGLSQTEFQNLELSVLKSHSKLLFDPRIQPKSRRTGLERLLIDTANNPKQIEEVITMIEKNGNYTDIHASIWKKLWFQIRTHDSNSDLFNRLMSLNTRLRVKKSL